MSAHGGTAERGERRRADAAFARGVARAFGGAIFFSLPLLMTMEMWWLGFTMPRPRLILLVLVFLPLLVALDHHAGFRRTETWGEDVIDALVAYAVGFVASAAVLLVFRVIGPGMPWTEIVGKVTLQAVPAGFGAVLASAQFGDGADEREEAGYGTELLLMAAGALFLAFNVAPTEEMVLLAHRATPWHLLALALASLAMMHAFVYAADFRGTERRAPHVRRRDLFLRFTVVGYAISLLVSAYVLWTFGRYDDAAHVRMVMEAVVLAFPASLGAAAARLIL